MPAAFPRNIAGFSPAGNSRSYFQGRKASEMKRKCRPKGLAQNPGNARQIIVHFMILRQTGAAQFMGPEPRAIKYKRVLSKPDIVSQIECRFYT